MVMYGTYGPFVLRRLRSADPRVETRR